MPVEAKSESDRLIPADHASRRPRRRSSHSPGPVADGRGDGGAAFTLIELLVVVTIIVVLLALLTPAMDQAIYRAELLRDGADKRALTQIINLYAMDHRRWYPYRPPRTGDTPRHLAGNAAEGAVTGARLDVRPQLRPYLDINRFFNDPFVEEPVDYDRPSSDNAYIWASIHFFFGYSHWEGRGMTKLGTRWTIGGSWNAADRDFGFSVMIGCRDYIFGTALAVEGSHPDKEGLMTSFSQQEEQGFPAAYTNAGWSSNIGRGPVDLNFVLADESLSQWNDVVQDRTNFRPDDRMAWIPTNSYYAGTNYLTIPYE